MRRLPRDGVIPQVVVAFPSMSLDWGKLHRAHVSELERRYGKPRAEFDDQYWALRPTPEFQHWLPLAQADCALLLRVGQRPKLVWTQPPNFWEKPAAPEGDF